MIIVEGSAIEIDAHAEAALKQFQTEYVSEMVDHIRRYDLQDDRRLLIAFIHDSSNAMKRREALEKAYRCGVAHERHRQVSVKRCAYCGALAEGKHFIHRDGLGLGPEVPLCNGCGGSSRPTEEEIWSRIGQAKKCLKCNEPIQPEHTRFGSFHARCFG